MQTRLGTKRPVCRSRIPLGIGALAVVAALHAGCDGDGSVSPTRTPEIARAVQNQGGIQYEIQQPGMTVAVEPLTSPFPGETVRGYYGYDDDDNSENGTNAQVDQSVLFLFRDDTGVVSLVMIHDGREDQGNLTGGTATFTFAGVPAGTGFVVEDDPGPPPAGDGLSLPTPTWLWPGPITPRPQTDGGALSGSLDGTFGITISGVAFTGINGWKFLSDGEGPAPDEIVLDMSEDLRIIATDGGGGRDFTDWVTAPAAFDMGITRIPSDPDTCPGCPDILERRSGFTGGTYGVDADGDGVIDATLTAEAELVSRIETLADTTFRFIWTLRNLGSGAITGIFNPKPVVNPQPVGGPVDWEISPENPLLGTAGADRLPGTADDIISPVPIVITRVVNPTPAMGIPPITGFLDPIDISQLIHWGKELNPRTPLDGVMLLSVFFVAIDIDPDAINCTNATGVITVAVLTTDDFDATTVDHATVSFEGASETHSTPAGPKRHEQDADGDGDTDLVFHFRRGETDLTCASTAGTLTGYGFGGGAIAGANAVNMIDPGRL